MSSDEAIAELSENYPGAGIERIKSLLAYYQSRQPQHRPWRYSLDENLPHSLIGHDVMSVDYMGWSGEKNGELLTLCEAEGFDVLLTGDQNLSYQQIIADRRIAVVILDTLDLNALRKFADRIVDAIDRATPGSCQVVRSISNAALRRKQKKPTVP
jgi:hypothetical protein